MPPRWRPDAPGGGARDDRAPLLPPHPLRLHPLDPAIPIVYLMAGHPLSAHDEAIRWFKSLLHGLAVRALRRGRTGHAGSAQPGKIVQPHGSFTSASTSSVRARPAACPAQQRQQLALVGDGGLAPLPHGRADSAGSRSAPACSACRRGRRACSAPSSRHQGLVRVEGIQIGEHRIAPPDPGRSPLRCSGSVYMANTACLISSPTCRALWCCRGTWDYLGLAVDAGQAAGVAQYGLALGQHLLAHQGVGSGALSRWSAPAWAADPPHRHMGGAKCRDVGGLADRVDQEAGGQAALEPFLLDLRPSPWDCAPAGRR